MDKILWLKWARALQAISQTGLHYTDNQYDRERYEQIARIYSEIIANQSNLTEKSFSMDYK